MNSSTLPLAPALSTPSSPEFQYSDNESPFSERVVSLCKSSGETTPRSRSNSTSDKETEEESPHLQRATHGTRISTAEVLAASLLKSRRMKELRETIEKIKAIKEEQGELSEKLQQLIEKEKVLTSQVEIHTKRHEELHQLKKEQIRAKKIARTAQKDNSEPSDSETDESRTNDHFTPSPKKCCILV